MTLFLTKSFSLRRKFDRGYISILSKKYNILLLFVYPKLLFLSMYLENYFSYPESKNVMIDYYFAEVSAFVMSASKQQKMKFNKEMDTPVILLL